tara:strand:+ start:410 stop:607 length:198 start_codon:yes stop_codon:yes gene_type:complete
MSKFKFRGFIPAVTKYVKSKPVIEVVMDIFAFGFLMPLAVFGWIALVINLVVNGVDPNIQFGIYG